MLHTLFALLLLGAVQDVEKARSELRKAVAASDAAGVEAAVEKLTSADTKRAVDILLEAYGDCAKELKPLLEEKHRALQDVQASLKFDRALDQKAQEVEKRIRTVEALKRRIVQGLAATKSDGAVRELVSELKAPTVGGGDWTRRAGVAEALGRIEHPEALPALIESAGRDAEAAVRVAAVDGLREKKQKTPEVVAVLVSLLGHESWALKSTAVATLELLAARETTGALIEALAKADGRLRFELNRTLIAFTAVDKHGDYAAWKAWWDANQAEVRAGTYVPKKEERADNQAGGGTTFYGIPIHSRHVVFVLDRSGSMKEPSEWEIPKDVASGPSLPGADLKPAGDRKIDIARWQLKRALAMLPDGTEFNLIFYNHQWTGMSEQMLKLNATTRKQAFEFIDALEPEGRTNIYDPLERGLGFGPAMPGEKPPKSAAGPRPTVATGDKAPKGGADTIFLLSDGLPNTGQIPDPDGIIAKVKEINRGKKMTINTIGVFGSRDRDGEAGVRLMKQLSADAGGVYSSGGKAEKKAP